MNRSSAEEYEEVESPFAAPRERLRTRKNVFNRPFAADSTVAPAVFETTSTRKSIGHPDFTDMIKNRAGEVAETNIDYIDGEEEEDEILPEVVEKRVPRNNTSAKKKTKNNIIPKILWAIIGLLILRLIFMDRGVWDYFATEKNIDEKHNELRAIGVENKELKTEIGRVKMDGGFQRQLAKEHLGVIAADEFLILFAGESAESSTPDTTL